MRGRLIADRIADIAWPLSRLAEGIEALAIASGLAPRGKMNAAPSGASPRDARDAQRFERLGDWLGVALEPVSFGRREALTFVQGSAPALLLIQKGFLLLVRARRNRAVLLAPDGRMRRVSVAALASALNEEAAPIRSSDLERGLLAAGLSEAERASIHSIASRDRTGSALVAWLIRPPVEAPWRTVARSLRLGPRLGGVLAAKSLEQTAWVLSWWLIGRGALEGRFEPGWLAAWALLLACMVPLQIGTLLATGRISVDLGAEIRRRLMAGALRMRPDVLRREGVGQALGRVLESEALETLALGGGFLALFAGVEVAVALFVLGAGASPLMHVTALLAWLVLALLLAWRYIAARAEWTDRRLGLTHDLIESMVGHATRLVQQDPRRIHSAEDGALASLVPSARAMDRAMVALTAWIPRGWMLFGVLAAGPAFLSGASNSRLAISLGGVLLAYRALRQMVEGLADLAAAAVAWRRVAPMLREVEHVGTPAEPALLAAEEDARPSESVPVLSAHSLSFRHAGQAQGVLERCDLEIRRGEKLVLEGRSGSGKSTLASLLGGLRAPDAGLVLAGGLDRKMLGERGWRERIALAPQFHENHVFGGSLLFNLLMGRTWPPSPEDIRAAEETCGRVGLGPLLARMPGGILQWVGETGWRLSHGERVRVWIARALLQGSQVLVVDEGLDALDPRSLRCVQEVLLQERAAVLLVAHP